MALAAVLLTARTVAGNGRWTLRLSRPYRGALGGVVLLTAAAAADAGWHAAFGTEEGLAALLSPTHLLLGLAAALFLSARLQAAWPSPERHLPVALRRIARRHRVAARLQPVRLGGPHSMARCRPNAAGSPGGRE